MLNYCSITAHMFICYDDISQTLTVWFYLATFDHLSPCSRAENVDMGDVLMNIFLLLCMTTWWSNENSGLPDEPLLILLGYVLSPSKMAGWLHTCYNMFPCIHFGSILKYYFFSKQNVQISAQLVCCSQQICISHSFKQMADVLARVQKSKCNCLQSAQKPLARGFLIKPMCSFSVKLSCSSQLLNILSPFEPQHAKWSIQFWKSVKHTLYSINIYDI